jgi:sensor histidine kinase YesM
MPSMKTVAEGKQGFWKVYTSNVRSIVILVVVCALIAMATSFVNGLGYWQNLLFSFCYGFPISLVETQMRLWQKPLPDYLINIFSVIIGSLFGSIVVYTYLVKNNIIPFGTVNGLLIFNFAFGFAVSAAAFYFFWSRYRNQALTLALRDQQLKAAELENLKRQAENRLLQSQMEPHFLFNTLANIQSLIDIDSQAAKTMVNDLSQMLRASLKYSTLERCTVEQEVSLVRSYLGIQRIRMGDRLIIKEDIGESAIGGSIIPMVIQPLVENAIKHGVEKSTGACTVVLSIQVEDGMLSIDVTDDCEHSHPPKQGHGISLNNIQQRLENQFGDSAKLVSEPLQKGWQTKLLVPFQQAKEAI